MTKEIVAYEYQVNEVEQMLNLAIRELQDLKHISHSCNPVSFTTKYAMMYVGKWYKWGGSTPAGFDCSGFTLELLKMNGFVGRGIDLTAQGQWDKFLKKRTNKVAGGCFVCYNIGKTNRIGHIEYCISDRLCIGASGGGSKTLTEADAIRDEAFIKVRPIVRDRDIAGFFNPFIKEAV